jgi:hypothetical protein
MEMVRETVEYRERNDMKRNDFMQLLIQMKNKTLVVAEEEDTKQGNLEEDCLKNSAPFGKCSLYIYFLTQSLNSQSQNIYIF